MTGGTVGGPGRPETPRLGGRGRTWTRVGGRLGLRPAGGGRRRRREVLVAPTQLEGDHGRVPADAGVLKTEDVVVDDVVHRGPPVVVARDGPSPKGARHVREGGRRHTSLTSRPPDPIQETSDVVALVASYELVLTRPVFTVTLMDDALEVAIGQPAPRRARRPRHGPREEVGVPSVVEDDDRKTHLVREGRGTPPGLRRGSAPRPTPLRRVKGPHEAWNVAQGGPPHSGLFFGDHRQLSAPQVK